MLKEVGGLEGGRREEGGLQGDRGTRKEDRIQPLIIVSHLYDALFWFTVLIFHLKALKVETEWRRGRKENTPQWLQMVGSVLFETTIITGQLQSSRPLLGWRLGYLCHQRAALSPDRGFTVQRNRDLTHKHTQTYTFFAHKHSFRPSLALVKWILWCHLPQCAARPPSMILFFNDAFSTPESTSLHKLTTFLEPAGHASHQKYTACRWRIPKQTSSEAG